MKSADVLSESFWNPHPSIGVRPQSGLSTCSLWALTWIEQHCSIPGMRGLCCLFAFPSREAQSYWAGQTPANPASRPSTILPHDPLSFPTAPAMKNTQRSYALWCSPKASSVVHWVVVCPTTAEVHDPWTPFIRLSAPAMASDTHRASAREWKHTTGKCINVREMLEPYKMKHFTMHAVQLCLHARPHTPAPQRNVYVKGNNVSRCTEAVCSRRAVCHTHIHVLVY